MNDSSRPQCVQRVLLVDDYEPQRNAWRRELSRRGLKCSLAANRAQAISAVQSEPHQLAIVDLYLNSEDNGLAIVEELRAFDPTMTIILVSADMPVDAAVRAMSRGAMWACNKPLDWATVLDIANGNPPPPLELGPDQKDFDTCVKELLERALVKTLGNQSAAAEWLNEHRTSFLRRCARADIKLPRRARRKKRR